MSAEIVTVDITTARDAAYRGRRRHPNADDRLAVIGIAVAVVLVVVGALLVWMW